jgi:hypothetical protein
MKVGKCYERECNMERNVETVVKNVTIDGETNFVAITKLGEVWNGFEVPYFDFVTALEVLAWAKFKVIVTLGEVIKYFEPDYNEWIEIHPVVINNETFWSVGGMEWVWSESEDSNL